MVEENRHDLRGNHETTRRALEKSQFLKDLALAGSALVMFAAFAALGHGLGLVIAGPLFNFR